MKCGSEITWKLPSMKIIDVYCAIPSFSHKAPTVHSSVQAARVLGQDQSGGMSLKKGSIGREYGLGDEPGEAH